MAYTAVQAASFSGGLNLRDSYEQMEVNQAYDLLNVAFDARGGVKSRPGYAAFNAAGTNRYDSMTAFYTTGGTRQLVVGAGNRLEVFDNTGAAVAGSSTSTAPTASPHQFTRFGGPTKTVVYAANGTDALRQWNGTAWNVPTQTTVSSNFSASASTISVASTTDFPSSGQIVIGAMTITYTGTTSTSFTGCTGVTSGGSSGDLVSRTFVPKGKYVSVTPWDNRLVNANFTPASPAVGGYNRSTVRFSDPSVPDTWQTDNWIDLTPGDGEQIMGMCTFNNYLIVFKETRFFVIYGTNIATDGTPEFAYRAVEAGVGLTASNAFCVAPDAVYFLFENGIYKTDGGLPLLVSGLIDPLFTGNVPLLFGGLPINQSAIGVSQMAYNGLQVYAAVPTGSATTNNRILVFDLRNQSWSVWDIAASSMCQFRVSGSQADLMFSYAAGDKKIGRVSAGYSTDAGATINSRIKMAFNDFGDNNHKTIRESKVWGTGELVMAIADDFNGSSNGVNIDFGSYADRWADGTDNSDLWADGTNPNDLWSNSVGTHAQLARTSVRGTYLSVEFYNSTASTPSVAWSVNKMVHHIRERRVPSVTNLDGE